MQVVLVMFRSDGERRSFSVTRDVTVIGRREDCDLRIPLSDVSRKHCRFIRDGETIRVEDLGSSNGTYHNGQRVQEAELAPGDTIQVGPVIFCIQLDGLPAEEDMSPLLTAPSEAAPFSEPATYGTDETVDEENAAEESLEAQAEPAGEEELAIPEEEAVVEEEAPSLEAEVPEEEFAGLEDLAAEPEAVAEEEPLALEEPAVEEEALAVEDSPLSPARGATPPPIPPAAPAEVAEDDGADAFAIEDEPVAEEEQGTEEDLLEDFEITSDEPEDSQGGDFTVESEQK